MEPDLMTRMLHKFRPFTAAALCNAAAVITLNLTALAPPTAYAKSAVSPVRQIEAARKIADLGREIQDPVLLVAAARVMITSGAQIPVSGPSVDPHSIQPYDPWSANALLADAGIFANMNKAIEAAIQETSGEQYRGVLTGPSQTDEIIKPGQVQRFAFSYVARERADAGLRIKPGQAGATLSIEAIDGQGRRVAIAASPARFNQAAYVEWNPRRCGSFTIIVRNTGSVAAAYRLSTAPSETGIDCCLASGKSPNCRKVYTGK
jgi:hypothetical protein